MEVKKKTSILIVEDNPQVSLYEKNFLERSGYRVTAIAVSAQSAYNAILKDQPDIILMDVMIEGGIDGIAASAVIREKYNIPVIFVSAIEDKTNIDRIRETEAYGFMTKPFSEYGLTVVIESAIHRHNLENRIRMNEQKYRFIFENIHDVYFEVTSEGIITEISPSIKYISIYPREELLKESFAKILKNEKDLEYILSVGVLKKGTVLHDIKVHGSDGGIRLCDMRIVPGLNADGSVVRIIGSIHDITERKSIEDSERESKKEIESLMMSLSSILIGVTTRDKISHWNRTAETVFNQSSQDMIGRAITAVNIQWEWARIYEAISQSVTNECSVSLTELKYAREKNVPMDRYLNVKITPVRDFFGVLKGFMIVGDDITENRNMRIRMNQAMKMEAIGELSAGIAHEINTPMQYINDNTLFIRDSFEKIMQMDKMFFEYKDKDPYTAFEAVTKKAVELDIPFVLKEVPQAISQTLDGISRITKIVQSMKQFSHPGTQNKELYSINKIVDDVTTITRNEWKYVAELETDLDPELPRINCFPNALSQVFLNIIVNAAQSIEEKIGNKNTVKGKISISTRHDDASITIKISDTGKGIPEKIRQKIFDPFFTTKDVGKGTGQGLAISHSIVVDMHGGSISAESIPEEGTTFTVIIPADTIVKNEEEEEDEI